MIKSCTSAAAGLCLGWVVSTCTWKEDTDPLPILYIIIWSLISHKCPCFQSFLHKVPAEHNTQSYLTAINCFCHISNTCDYVHGLKYSLASSRHDSAWHEQRSDEWESGFYLNHPTSAALYAASPDFLFCFRHIYFRHQRSAPSNEPKYRVIISRLKTQTSVFLWGQADFNKIHVSSIDSNALNLPRLINERIIKLLVFLNRFPSLLKFSK